MTYSFRPKAPSISTRSSSAPKRTTAVHSGASPWSAPSPKRCWIKTPTAAPPPTPSTSCRAPYEHLLLGPNALAPGRRRPGRLGSPAPGQIPQPGFRVVVRGQTQNDYQRLGVAGAAPGRLERGLPPFLPSSLGLSRRLPARLPPGPGQWRLRPGARLHRPGRHAGAQNRPKNPRRHLRPRPIESALPSQSGPGPALRANLLAAATRRPGAPLARGAGQVYPSAHPPKPPTRGSPRAGRDQRSPQKAPPQHRCPGTVKLLPPTTGPPDRKSTRLNSSHLG